MSEMPDDGRDADGWGRYWRRTVGEPRFGDHYSTVGRGLGAIWLRDRLSIPVPMAPEGRRPRILFAGNGHSPEPWLYAHWGCECVVLDVSPTACAAPLCQRG